MNVCDFKSTHMIVYDVLTGRRQDGEQESGTNYTISGLAHQVYK